MIVKPPRGRQLIKGHPINRGLVGFWPMNEGGGGKVFDASGQTGSATFGSGADAPTWSTTGVLFDNDYLTIADNAGVMPPHITVVTRIRKNADFSSFGMIFGTRHNYGLWLAFEPDEKLEIRINNTSGWTDLGVAWVIGDTRTVAVTWDGSMAHLYTDGVLTASNDFGDSNLSWGVNAVRVGKDYGGSYPAYITMEWMALHDRALTPSEIASLYRDPWQGYRWEPIALWTAAMGEPGVTYSGSGQASLTKVTATGSGTFAGPVYSGSGQASLGKVTATGAGTFAPPVYAGSGAGTLPKVTASGAGAFAPPVYSGSGSATIQQITAIGVGHYGVLYCGAGSGTLPRLAASGAGTFEPLEATAAAFFLLKQRRS